MWDDYVVKNHIRQENDSGVQTLEFIKLYGLYRRG